MGLRLLVCGGRNFRDYLAVKNELVKLRPDVVIHGAASGADSMADRAARDLGISREPYPADWEHCADTCPGWHHRRKRRDGGEYCPTAGFRRNQQMIDEGRPSMVLAFPGGSGTADMVRRAQAAGIEVRRI